MSARPAGPPGSTPVDVLRRAGDAAARHGRVALAQIVRVEGSTAGKAGWKLLVSPDGETEGNLGGGAFEAMVIADARARLAARRPEGEAGELKRYYMTEQAAKGEATGMVCGGFAEVYLEVIEAPPVALVYGGGPVGQALARGAELAGFDLVVVDDRPAFRRPELFPEAATIPDVDRHFASAEGADYLAPVAGRELYAAIVTRCWETDVAAIATLLGKAPERLAYLGLMGSRRKIERVRRELEALGVSLDGVRLHAPIGLDLGGDSPGEIAIATLAEMIQARYGKG